MKLTASPFPLAGHKHLFEKDDCLFRGQTPEHYVVSFMEIVRQADNVITVALAVSGLRNKMVFGEFAHISPYRSEIKAQKPLSSFFRPLS
jgi:hypothetical protein